MDPWRDLLKMGWITLVASLAVVAVLALLPSRAGAADVEHVVVYSSVGPITR